MAPAITLKPKVWNRTIIYKRERKKKIERWSERGIQRELVIRRHGSCLALTYNG